MRLLLILLSFTYICSFLFSPTQHTPAPNDSLLNVYLIPHSHDDVGWLKTPDEYFYGDDQSTQWASVRYTLDSVVTELSVDADLKFSIVEIAFLDMWWRNTNQTMRDLMSDHVKKGKIQFINAGWCMSDQATVYYEDAIDQMTIGMRWVKEKFGSIPTVAWQIDPFGHQASFATLGHQFGFNSIFFARVHYQDKNVRESSKSMQLLWKPPQSSGNEDGLLAHINFYAYNPPAGFCYDRLCMDEPVKSDPTLQGYNLDTKSKAFVQYFKNMSKSYKSTNLLHTLGSDFQWSNARLWTLNIGRLMKYINSKPQLGVNVRYATPSEYIEAIYKEGLTYPTKTDDFFPYADYTDAYWSGYFTSRVAIKGFVRDTSRWLQGVRTHIALLKISNGSSYLNSHLNESENAVLYMQKLMGILQHHDAVSGTQKQKVANHYISTASKAKFGLISFFNNIIQQQANSIIGEMPSQIFQTHWNETYSQWGIAKSLASSKPVLLHLYNPGPEGEYPIRIKIDPRNLSIIGAGNNSIAGEIICGNTKDAQDCELFFNIKINETSWNYVKLQPAGSSGNVTIIPIKELSVLSPTKEIKLSSTATIKIHRSQEKFELILGQATHSFSLAYNYYESYQQAGQKSGAYIFRPSSATKNSSKKYSSLKSLYYSEGAQMVMISLLEDKTYTKLYVSKHPGYVEQFGVQIQTFVDSINVTDKQGKEIVLDITTSVANNKTFYTDSNGLEEQKRILNTMPTWNLTVHQPVAGNYYPINSHIKINDSKQIVSVLVDRARGGSVLKDGIIQVMLHRRTLYDDERGVWEALNEADSSGNGLTQKVRNYLLFGNNNRQLQKRLDQPVLITWSNTASSTFVKYSPKGAVFSVPKQVKCWMRSMPDNSYLLRVQHIDSVNSSSSVVKMPEGWSVTELTLGGNQLLSEWKQRQYKWKGTSSTTQESFVGESQANKEARAFSKRLRPISATEISLKSLEIRTFSLSI